MTPAGKLELVMQMFDSGLLCECGRLYMMPSSTLVELDNGPLNPYYENEMKLIINHIPNCDGVKKVFEWLDK